MEDFGVSAARGILGICKSIAERIILSLILRSGGATGKTAKRVLNGVLNSIPGRNNTLNLQKITNSNKEIDMLEVSKNDVSHFMKYAKQHMIPVAVIKEKEGVRKLLFTKDFTPLMRSAGEDLINSKVNNENGKGSILTKLENIREKMAEKNISTLENTLGTVKESVLRNER